MKKLLLSGIAAAALIGAGACGASSGGDQPGAGGSSAGAAGGSACKAVGANDSPPPPDGGFANCAPGAGTGDLPCDVSAVLVAKCSMCHTCPHACGAPFPLLSYEDLTAPFGTSGKQRWQRVAEVIDPTNPNGSPAMPFKQAPGLSDGERATLLAWTQAGAPALPEGMGCDPRD